VKEPNTGKNFPFHSTKIGKTVSRPIRTKDELLNKLTGIENYEEFFSYTIILSSSALVTSYFLLYNFTKRISEIYHYVD